MTLISANQKRAERRESLLLNISSETKGWRRTGQQVLAMIQEERQASSIFKSLSQERFQQLARRGFWQMLERDGYTVMLVEGGVQVGW